MKKNSRAFVSVLIALVLFIANSARADLLVSSFDSFQILRFDDVTGAFLGAFATGLPGDRPLGMTIGPDGNLYVGVNNFGPPFGSFIRRFDPQTGALIDTFASGGNLDGPTHLVFGPDGNLYVASFGGTAPFSKVIRYNGTTGAFIDDFVPVGSGGLNGIEGLVFGPVGNLYVTSRVNNEILRYDGSTGTFLGVFATGGQNGPVDLTFGPDGNLYVLNSPGGQLEVLRFNGVTGIFIDAFVPGFSGGTDGTSLVFGPDGNLYVTTGFFVNSVRRFNGSTGQLIGDFVPQGSGGLAYATGLLFLNRASQLVTINIRQSINPRSKGVLPVAIPSTDAFDARTLDPTTVRFGATGTEAAPVHVAFQGDNHGHAGVILQFRIQDTGIACGDTSASLTGKTFGGQSIQGSDSFRTVGCK
jgi:DNA-binding beta-propeller fold protein YncE